MMDIKEVLPQWLINVLTKKTVYYACMVRDVSYVSYTKFLILILKLVLLLEYQNIRTLLQKAMFQIGLKKFLLLQKLEILCQRHSLLVILKANKLLERCKKNSCKKEIKKSLELKKITKTKNDKLYVKWKDLRWFF